MSAAVAPSSKLDQYRMDRANSRKIQKVTAEDCARIQSLGRFDMEMLVSEIHDHGWPHARLLLAEIAAEADARSASIDL